VSTPAGLSMERLFVFLVYAGCIALASIPTVHLLQDGILGVEVFGWAPFYLCELCRPLSSCAGHCTLWSSVHSNLVVPFARSATVQTRSFYVVGPTTWNGLPIDLRLLPNSACSQFHHPLKTVLFRLAWVGSAFE